MKHLITFVTQTNSLSFSKRVVLSFTVAVFCVATFDTALFAQASNSTDAPHTKRQPDSIRFATFNVSLNRRSEGQLTKELESGTSEQATQIAAIIQAVRPDVI